MQFMIYLQEVHSVKRLLKIKKKMNAMSQRYQKLDPNYPIPNLIAHLEHITSNYRIH